MEKDTMPLKSVPCVSLPKTDDPLKALMTLFAGKDDIVSYDSFYGKVVVVNHPKYARDISKNSEGFIRTPLIRMITGNGLVSSEGTYWHNQRRLAQPSFHAHCLHGFSHMILGQADQMIEKWSSPEFPCDAFDFSMEIRELTMQVIMQTMLSTTLESDALTNWVTLFNRSLNTVSPFVLGQLGIPVSVHPEDSRQQKKAIEELDGYIYELIEQRRAASEPPTDFLTNLLNGLDKTEGRPLSDQQIRDEIFTMLLAGHETTAITISWIMHELMQDPATMDALYSEVDTVLRGQAPSHENLKDLPRLDQVIKESIRLHPAAWIISRVAQGAQELGGYTIPPNTLVIISTYTMHRHPDFWERPEQFTPEHFLPEAVRTRDKSAYMPFLTGKHQCIGQGFALLESGLVLARFLQKYRFEAVAGRQATAAPGFTLQLKDGLWLKVSPRAQG